MKKKVSLGILAAALLLTTGSMTACGKKGGNNSVDNGSSSNHTTSTSSQAPAEFAFTVSLSNGTKILNKGEEAHINIDENGGGDTSVTRKYTFVSSDSTVVDVDSNAKVVGIKEGSARILITETVSNISVTLSLTVIDAVPATGGYNYASLAGEEAVAKRTEILGSLEKYAMDNHLTGITLFENGGLVKYSERVELPTTNYITGYGFGLLSEGRILSDMDAEENPNYKRYLHTSSSSDPKAINARDDVGSQIADLEGYITSSFWGTKLNKTKDKYVWYPVLARDTIKIHDVDTSFDRPIPIYENNEVMPDEDPNPLGLYRTWRIYVKTGDNSGLKYRYNGESWKKPNNDGTINFDSRKVALEDYEFAYRLLLTGSHGLERGAEFAGDKTYGIVGAQKYYNNTNNETITDAQAKSKWEEMKADGSLGIKTGTDSVNGDYIQLTILNPIDRFTAMYTFSSNLLSPMPEEFVQTIGEGSIKAGAKFYGKFNNTSTAPEGHQDKILDFTISVGPYMLEKWDKKQAIYFKKNDQWNEPGRYNIEGIKILIIEAAQTLSTAIYDRFTNTKDLDSCGIPVKYVQAEEGQPRVYKTKGDSTFKLNVNSCDTETFNKLFGPQGTINKNSNWTLKPWMSNNNFLNGLFYSINRKQFASSLGVQPSINYFSNAYLSDPENGVSYNDSEAHKKAVEAYQTYDANNEDMYGYSRDRAILCFQSAVKELLNADLEDYPEELRVKYGTKAKPFEMHIHIRWMYDANITEYGNKIASYFTDAFNDDRVCGGRIKLIVDQEAPTTDWEQVYDEYLMKGQFDLGFGAISGNTYNPLNFMQVLKSDNESGFTLNWGTDTSKITTNKPIIYDNKTWSFDALWAVADHGGVVENGSIAKTVRTSYLVSEENEYYQAPDFSVVTQFIDVDSAKLEVSRVQICVKNGQSFDVNYTLHKEGDTVTAQIIWDATLAEEINAAIQEAQNIGDSKKDNYDPTPFVLTKYGQYWTVEVSYTIAIKAEGSDSFGTPTETYVESAKNKASWKDNQEEQI